MKKTSVAGLFTATSIVALSAVGSAFAVQNVANPGQKGSLLIWPAILVDPVHNEDTLVEISNDANNPVQIRCEYVNELQGRVDFSFGLSAKGTASWDVGTHAGDRENPPQWPTYTGNPTSPFPGGSAHRGELVCFAVNNAVTFQIAWNELTGTATPVKLDATVSAQLRTAGQYNAWAFAARTCLGDAKNCTTAALAPDNASAKFGTPGTLPLTGLNELGNYDACPAHNIQNFIPNGATLGNLTTKENDLHVVSCYQDLRQDYKLHLTKLQFTVWNANEDQFGGSFQCVGSVNTVQLLSSANPHLVNATLFDFATLRTPNARFMVQGVANNNECPSMPSTENTGLLAVVSSSVEIANGTETNQIGSNTSGAAAFSAIDDSSGLAGAVWWDPASQ
jgi:hypothetical protein